MTEDECRHPMSSVEARWLPDGALEDWCTACGTLLMTQSAEYRAKLLARSAAVNDAARANYVAL